MRIDVKFSTTSMAVPVKLTDTGGTKMDASFSDAVLVPAESDHSKLQNRDAADQHPIEAITGLREALEEAANSGTSYEVGHGLKLENEKTLCVDTAKDFEGDNTLPITAAAVQETVGNIEIILATI